MPPSESDLRFESSPPTFILREPLRYFSEQVKECLLLQRHELAFALASSALFIAFIMKNLAFTGPWMDPGCSLLCSPVPTVGTQALFTDASVSGAGTEELFTEQLLFLGLWYLSETLGTQYAGKKSMWDSGMVPGGSMAVWCHRAPVAWRIISWCSAVCFTGEPAGLAEVRNRLHS